MPARLDGAIVVTGRRRKKVVVDDEARVKASKQASKRFFFPQSAGTQLWSWTLSSHLQRRWLARSLSRQQPSWRICGFRFAEAAWELRRFDLPVQAWRPSGRFGRGCICLQIDRQVCARGYSDSPATDVLGLAQFQRAASKEAAKYLQPSTNLSSPTTAINCPDLCPLFVTSQVRVPLAARPLLPGARPVQCRCRPFTARFPFSSREDVAGVTARPAIFWARRVLASATLPLLRRLRRTTLSPKRRH